MTLNALEDLVKQIQLDRSGILPSHVVPLLQISNRPEREARRKELTTTLSTLVCDMQYLQGAIDQLNSYRLTEFKASARAANSFSLIHTFPTEILMMILEEAILNDSSCSQNQAAGAVSQVSRLWRSVALANPLFRTDFSFTPRDKHSVLDYIDLLLTRSNGRLLNLTIDADSELSEQAAQLIQMTHEYGPYGRERTVPNSRIRGLAIRSPLEPDPNSGEFLDWRHFRQLESSLPFLEELVLTNSVQMGMGDWGWRVAELYRGWEVSEPFFPCLRHVRLHMIDAPKFIFRNPLLSLVMRCGLLHGYDIDGSTASTSLKIMRLQNLMHGSTMLAEESLPALEEVYASTPSEEHRLEFNSVDL